MIRSFTKRFTSSCTEYSHNIILSDSRHCVSDLSPAGDIFLPARYTVRYSNTSYGGFHVSLVI